MNQNFCTLYVPEKFMSQSNALRGTLDKSRDISNDKSFSALEVYDTEIGIECCEMIIGNLWSCICDTGQQCGFSNIRKSYKPYICDYL